MLIEQHSRFVDKDDGFYEDWAQQQMDSIRSWYHICQQEGNVQ